MSSQELSARWSKISWLLPRKPKVEAKVRLFCFPYAGGGASIFRSWGETLPSSIEVCAAQLPGREAKLNEPPYSQVAPLVEATVEAIAPLLDKPCALFGHSMGAIICFELARRLRRERGVEPAHLFVSGRRAPQIPDKDSPTFDLPEAEFVEELRSLNGTPKEVLENDELRALMLPLLRADFSVCQNYTYSAEPPLSCPITALGGLQDFHVPRKFLEGWGEQTSAAFSVRMFLGDHFFLHPAQTQMLRIIAQELQAVR